MAGGINLASKYSDVVDERWHSRSQATLVTSRNNYDFRGDRTVVIYSIPIAPLVDYTRSGSSRYGTPDDLSRNIQTLVVSRDKAFTFNIDRGDYVQSQFVSSPGAALARQLNEVIIPDFDTYCFRTMSTVAKDNGNYDSTAITTSNAYEMLQKGMAFFGNHNVPADNCYCFCTYEFANLLMRDNSFMRYGNASQEMLMRGICGEADGVRLVRVPKTKLLPGSSFLLVHKDAIVAPKQLEEFKIHEDPVGLSGWLVEGRVLYDCFVLDEKINGVYFHGGQQVISDLRAMSAASASGKTKIIINEDKAATSNIWYLKTAATKAALPTVTYGTMIDMTASGAWVNPTTLTSTGQEITPTSGHKYAAIVETDANAYPKKYTVLKLNIG